MGLGFREFSGLGFRVEGIQEYAVNHNVHAPMHILLGAFLHQLDWESLGKRLRFAAPWTWAIALSMPGLCDVAPAHKPSKNPLRFLHDP